MKDDVKYGLASFLEFVYKEIEDGGLSLSWSAFPNSIEDAKGPKLHADKERDPEPRVFFFSRFIGAAVSTKNIIYNFSFSFTLAEWCRSKPFS